MISSARRHYNYIVAFPDGCYGWMNNRVGPRNVHSAEYWEEVLLPGIERQQQQGKQVA